MMFRVYEGVQRAGSDLRQVPGLWGWCLILSDFFKMGIFVPGGGHFMEIWKCPSWHLCPLGSLGSFGDQPSLLWLPLAVTPFGDKVEYFGMQFCEP